MLHRTDGPAREFMSGAKWWYQDGQYHREDGPAIEEANGYEDWYIRGQQLTEEEFNERTKNRDAINTEQE